MKNKPILFIDSGIGGLLYCKEFLKYNPNEEVCCLADNLNFPYGGRTKEELCAILISLIDKLLVSINPKIIVLACNTAAISALDVLRDHYPGITFVGTVPAIKPAVNSSKTKKIGILGTARTVEDPYNKKLLNECKVQCEIIPAAAPDLVEFVEHKLDNAGETDKQEIVKKYIDIFRAQNADAIVLGCTHFLYLLEIFKREGLPDIQIFDSLNGITKRIEFLLDENNGALRAKENIIPEHKLILTGEEPPEPFWKERALGMRFNLTNLKDI